MKTSFLLFLVALIAASCNTGRDAVYSVASDFNNTAEMEVISSTPGIKPVAAISAPADIVVAEAELINAPVVINETATPVQKETTPLTAQQLKTKMAHDLRLVASTADSRFAGRILYKTADKIESKEFHTKEKLTFFDKAKLKLFEKIQNKYAVNSGMATSDILAIVSLCTGIVSLGAFYAAFFFGVAAIVTGALALKKGTARRGMAIAGIVLGAVGILLWSGLAFVFVP